MTSRGDAQNHSKMVSRVRLPVRYCIMAEGLSLNITQENAMKIWLWHKIVLSLAPLVLLNWHIK